MKIDEILAVIDTGLQTAGDTAYGNDFDGTCWRCRTASDTDLCAPCRAELVAEKPPAAQQYVTVWISVDVSEALAVCERVLDQFQRLPTAFRQQILDDVRDRYNPQGEHQ